MLSGRAAALVALVVLAHAPRVLAMPSVVFILLDTTRADRFGSWGNPEAPTPTLDALAARGARFAKHFANAHATRPSMPQLMSGRYYHRNVLAAFQTDAHPREMSFARTDPTAILLPAALRASGYATIGVSAHTWVAADSELGHAFDRLELLPFTVAQGHGDAKPLVDRAIALWDGRDRTKPLFLYLHFMDAHIPRPPPPPIAGSDTRRFRPNGEPDFDRNRRRWSRHDARDFTDADRAYYVAAYDARLRYADGEIARLLAALRRDDPELRDTIVVVTADHGEELGEDGRIEHSASFVDGIHHVPWIVAGGSVERGVRCNAVTEHVDVVPSLLALLGVPAPAGVVFDGDARLTAAGRLAGPCGGRTAYYAWEDYRAVRLHHWVLVARDPRAPSGRCDGAETLFRLDGRRRRVAHASAARTARLRALLAARLDAREARYRATRYETPTVPFSVRADFWDVGDELRCVPVDEDTPRGAFRGRGWMWSGRGVAASFDAAPLPVRIAVPPGRYAIEAATTPLPPMPWLFGFARWRRHAFLHDDPTEFVPLGTVDAPAGLADVALPSALGASHHVLALRVVPPGATGRPAQVDPKERERLRALGYVE